MLRKALAGISDVEVRSRVETAMRPLEAWLAEELEARRGVRLVGLLQRLDTPASRAAIRRMANEGLTFQEIREAQSVARRLKTAGKK